MNFNLINKELAVHSKLFIKIENMKNYCYVKQEDSYDCGIAALATILLYYNDRHSLKDLKEIISYDSKKRTNLFQLYSIALKLGFQGTGMKLESLKDFNYVTLPCIAHLEFSKNFLHFIVIYKISENYITIFNPSYGLDIIKIEDFSRYFTGNILTIFPN